MTEAGNAGGARQKKIAKPVKKPALLKTSPNRDLRKPEIPVSPSIRRLSAVILRRA